MFLEWIEKRGLLRDSQHNRLLSPPLPTTVIRTIAHSITSQLEKKHSSLQQHNHALFDSKASIEWTMVVLGEALSAGVGDLDMAGVVVELYCGWLIDYVCECDNAIVNAKEKIEDFTLTPTDFTNSTPDTSSLNRIKRPKHLKLAHLHKAILQLTLLFDAKHVSMANTNYPQSASTQTPSSPSKSQQSLAHKNVKAKNSVDDAILKHRALTLFILQTLTECSRHTPHLYTKNIIIRSLLGCVDAVLCSGGGAVHMKKWVDGLVYPLTDALLACLLGSGQMIVDEGIWGMFKLMFSQEWCRHEAVVDLWAQYCLVLGRHTIDLITADGDKDGNLRNKKIGIVINSTQPPLQMHPEYIKFAWFHLVARSLPSPPSRIPPTLLLKCIQCYHSLIIGQFIDRFRADGEIGRFIKHDSLFMLFGSWLLQVCEMEAQGDGYGVVKAACLVIVCRLLCGEGDEDGRMASKRKSAPAKSTLQQKHLQQIYAALKTNLCVQKGLFQCKQSIINGCRDLFTLCLVGARETLSMPFVECIHALFTDDDASGDVGGWRGSVDAEMRYFRHSCYTILGTLLATSGGYGNKKDGTSAQLRNMATTAIARALEREPSCDNIQLLLCIYTAYSRQHLCRDYDQLIVACCVRKCEQACREYSANTRAYCEHLVASVCAFFTWIVRRGKGEYCGHPQLMRTILEMIHKSVCTMITIIHKHEQSSLVKTFLLPTLLACYHHYYHMIGGNKSIVMSLMNTLALLPFTLTQPFTSTLWMLSSGDNNPHAPLHTSTLVCEASILRSGNDAATSGNANCLPPPQSKSVSLYMPNASTLLSFIVVGDDQLICICRSAVGRHAWTLSPRFTPSAEDGNDAPSNKSDSEKTANSENSGTHVQWYDGLMNSDRGNKKNTAETPLLSPIPPIYNKHHQRNQTIINNLPFITCLSTLQSTLQEKSKIKQSPLLRAAPLSVPVSKSVFNDAALFTSQLSLTDGIIANPPTPPPPTNKQTAQPTPGTTNIKCVECDKTLLSLIGALDAADERIVIRCVLYCGKGDCSWLLDGLLECACDTQTRVCGEKRTLSSITIADTQCKLIIKVNSEHHRDDLSSNTPTISLSLDNGNGTCDTNTQPTMHIRAISPTHSTIHYTNTPSALATPIPPLYAGMIVENNCKKIIPFIVDSLVSVGQWPDKDRMDGVIDDPWHQRQAILEQIHAHYKQAPSK